MEFRWVNRERRKQYERLEAELGADLGGIRWNLVL